MLWSVCRLNMLIGAITGYKWPFCRFCVELVPVLAYNNARTCKCSCILVCVCLFVCKYVLFEQWSEWDKLWHNIQKEVQPTILWIRHLIISLKGSGTYGGISTIFLKGRQISWLPVCFPMHKASLKIRCNLKWNGSLLRSKFLSFRIDPCWPQLMRDVKLVLAELPLLQVNPFPLTVKPCCLDYHWSIKDTRLSA